MASAILRSGTDGVSPLDVILSTVALFVLAIAQPLLNLLGRNAEFFLARSAPSIDIVLIGLLLALIAPVALGLFVVLVRSIHEATGRALHRAVLTLLAATLALQVLFIVPLASASGWVEVVIALAVGAAIASAFYRIEPLRVFTNFASVGSVVVLGLFLFGSSTSQLLFGSPAIAQASEISVGSPAPVVMIVFDEFPVASLMDGRGELQETVYPSFARLARDGTWFSNAVTIEQQTVDALPPILSGRQSDGAKLPTAGDYPFTLFTLLADAYDLRVHEAVTDLCPEYACTNQTRPTLSIADRWASLLDDLQIVSGHVFLPDGLSESLPPIDASWSNFSGSQADGYDIIARFQEIAYGTGRLAPIASFLNDIEPPDSDEPSLYFLHAVVPHVPWEYLPTGQRFSSSTVAPGSKSPGWNSDEWLVDQAYQRHLLQVEFVDGVIGDLISRLEAAGIYDDALIVITADHGVAIRPDIRHRRVATDDTVGDIAAVPLFIKAPNQKSGGTDRYRAETIDVLPTIADILGIDVPWLVDGHSLYADSRPARTASTIQGSEGAVVFGVDGSEARAIAARKVEHFGNAGAFGLAPKGHADLLGMKISEMDIGSPVGFTTSIRNLNDYSDVDADGIELPAWISGVVRTPDVVYKHRVIAVGLNGEIVAVTRTDETEDGRTHYGAMIPPAAFVDGKNSIELVLVEGEGSTREFFRLR